MNKLLKKEFALSAHITTFFFIGFGLIAFIPNYPILIGEFFVCLGIFKSFQYYRESNDFSFSLLLPVSKKNIVKAKIYFVVIIELLGFLLTMVATIIRMTLLKDNAVYINNEMLTANLVSLGYALFIYGLFNLIFVKDFFKTCYFYGKPFIIFIIISYLSILVFEVLWHIPGFETLNSFGFENIGVQLIGLLCGVASFIIMTFVSYKQSVKNFEKVDL